MTGGVFVEIRSPDRWALRSEVWSLESAEMSGSTLGGIFRHVLLVIAPEVSHPTSAEIEVRFGFDEWTVEDVDCRVISSSQFPQGLMLTLDGPRLDTFALRLIDAFLTGHGAGWNWRALRGPDALNSWQVACLYLRHIVRKSGDARLDLSDTTWLDEESVFCALGEQLHGLGGYAGRDPTGFGEILTEEIQSGRSIELVLPRAPRSSIPDWLARLISELSEVARECGARVKVAER